MKKGIDQSEGFSQEVYLNILKTYCQTAHPKKEEYLSCINPLIAFLKEYKKLVINSKVPFSVKMLFLDVNAINLEDLNESNVSFQESINRIRGQVKEKYANQPLVIKRAEKLANTVRLLKREEVSLEIFKEITEKVRAMTNHVLLEDTADKPDATEQSGEQSDVIDQPEDDKNSKFLNELLLTACEKGDFDIFSPIYEKVVIASNALGLSEAAFTEVLKSDKGTEKSRLQIVQLLIENIRDLDGVTGEAALEIADAKGDLEITQFLKSCGAKRLEVEEPKKSIADIFRENDIMADLSASPGESLVYCLSSGGKNGINAAEEIINHHKEAVSHELKKLDINQRDSSGWTYLMIVINWKNRLLAEFLLENGADPNIPDEAGRTPLFEAASTGNLDMTKLLLDPKFGTDINYKKDKKDKKNDEDRKDDTIKTALFEAATASTYAHAEVFQFLIDSGADTTITNENGETAVEVMDKKILASFESILNVIFNTNSSAENITKSIRIYSRMTKYPHGSGLVDHRRFALALKGLYQQNKFSPKSIDAVHNLIVNAYGRAVKMYPESLELLEEYAKTFVLFGDKTLDIEKKLKFYEGAKRTYQQALESVNNTSDSMQEWMRQITVIGEKLERLREPENFEVETLDSLSGFEVDVEAEEQWLVTLKR